MPGETPGLPTGTTPTPYSANDKHKKRASRMRDARDCSSMHVEAVTVALA